MPSGFPTSLNFVTFLNRAVKACSETRAGAVSVDGKGLRLVHVWELGME